MTIYNGTEKMLSACRINKEIAKKLKITPVLDKLLEYKRNWI